MIKKKYFCKEGEIAFRLWSFAILLSKLEENPNEEKAKNLYEKIVDFSSSPLMEIKSTSEEQVDLQQLIDEITLMTRSIR